MRSTSGDETAHPGLSRLAAQGLSRDAQKRTYAVTFAVGETSRHLGSVPRAGLHLLDAPAQVVGQVPFLTAMGIA